jgi:hypothetical protein
MAKTYFSSFCAGAEWSAKTGSRASGKFRAARAVSDDPKGFVLRMKSIRISNAIFIAPGVKVGIAALGFAASRDLR